MEYAGQYGCYWQASCNVDTLTFLARSIYLIQHEFCIISGIVATWCRLTMLNYSQEIPIYSHFVDIIKKCFKVIFKGRQIWTWKLIRVINLFPFPLIFNFFTNFQLNMANLKKICHIQLKVGKKVSRRSTHVERGRAIQT